MVFLRQSGHLGLEHNAVSARDAHFHAGRSDTKTHRPRSGRLCLEAKAWTAVRPDG